VQDRTPDCLHARFVLCVSSGSYFLLCSLRLSVCMVENGSGFATYTHALEFFLLLCPGSAANWRVISDSGHERSAREGACRAAAGRMLPALRTRFYLKYRTALRKLGRLIMVASSTPAQRHTRPGGLSKRWQPS